MNTERGGMDFFVMLDQASFADLFTHGQRIVRPMPGDNTANGNRRPIIVGYGTPGSAGGRVSESGAIFAGPMRDTDMPQRNRARP
jgi:hypothetical protein